MTCSRLRLPALALLTLLTAALVPSGSPFAVAAADPALSDSAVTKSGVGRFADLDVTVGKTKALGNEAVKVSWKWTDADPGRHATDAATSWNFNYFSVFQCWGDGASGPDREQCQFGGQFNQTGQGGTNQRLFPFQPDPDKQWALSRVVSPVDVFGHTIAESTDPLEYSDGPHGYPVKRPTPGVVQPGIVPMHASPTTASPDGETVTSIETGAFFDIFGTNEVPLARTNADGSGQTFFETQTAFESQFLGCGARLRENPDGSADARKCWLVVVPRDSIDVGGRDVRALSGSKQALFSSPLSLSNWGNRITFPLDFEPVRQPCALGGVERPVVGHESLSVAVSSWQDPLCAGGQGYFYASTTDDIARSTASSSLPKLSVVTDPLPPDAVSPAQGSLVYAPLAASGVSISFFIERVYSASAGVTDPKYLPFNGTRVEQLNLTPRLVAKLLTQSYRYSGVIIDGGPAHLAKAPLSLIDDPDFLAVNKFTTPTGEPDLPRDLGHLSNQRDSLARIFVTSDDSDAVRLVWAWILADPEAQAFLAGTPDPYGMTINPFYKGVDKFEDRGVPRSSIARLDNVCINASVPSDNGSGTRLVPVCPLDAAPFVNSFNAGAALAGRGLENGFQSFTNESGVLKPGRPSPQLVGKRALIALTDTPSSQRRGLVAASLRNAAGEFVAPTTATMSIALSQAVEAPTAGVLRVPIEKVKDGGYPLTRISYGVTNPAKLDQAARDDYAAFTAFAATDGQIAGTRPGQLPIGYAPLPRALRIQGLVASEKIRTATAPSPVVATATGAPVVPTSRTPSAISVSRTSAPAATSAPSVPTTSLGATPQPATSPAAAPAASVDETGGGASGAAAIPGSSGSVGGTAGSVGGSRRPAPGAKPGTAPSPVPASPAKPRSPAEIQRVSALTPATPLGALRLLLPALALLAIGAAAASRLMVRRGGRPPG